MVPTYQFFMFPLKPNPMDESKPLHMYNNSALTNGNAYQVCLILTLAEPSF